MGAPPHNPVATCRSQPQLQVSIESPHPIGKSEVGLLSCAPYLPSKVLARGWCRYPTGWARGSLVLWGRVPGLANRKGLLNDGNQRGPSKRFLKSRHRTRGLGILELFWGFS